MAQEITIDIPLHGEISVSVAGVKGKSCKDVTKALEAALGTTTKDELTREAYEQPERVLNSNRR